MSIDLGSRQFRVALVMARLRRMQCRLGFQSLALASYHFSDASVVLWCSSDGQLQGYCDCYNSFNGSLCLHIPSAIDFHSERVKSGVRSSLRNWVSRGQ